MMEHLPYPEVERLKANVCRSPLDLTRMSHGFFDTLNGFCYFEVISNSINIRKIATGSPYATLKVDLQMLSDRTII